MDWISVKDRLPEGKARSVLVVVKIGDRPTEWREGWWSGEWVQASRYERKHITHWAEAPPLPSPATDGEGGAERGGIPTQPSGAERIQRVPQTSPPPPRRVRKRGVR